MQALTTAPLLVRGPRPSQSSAHASAHHGAVPRAWTSPFPKLRACKALTTARPLSASPPTGAQLASLISGCNLLPISSQSPPTGAQLASLISGANATHELLNIYQDYRDQLDARHVVQLWPRLAKRVTSENARATDRVHTWVVQHRVILGHLVSHCVKVHAH